jgi:WD40 repeat protein/class 3 adenylate cyclase/tRNA A-37 threonylcarbamoyl transferase component Bud32
MASQFPSGQEDRVEAFGRKHRTGLVTLVFTDMVDSTALKQELGDRAAAEFFGAHHNVIRENLRRFPNAEEIETAGDSFFLIFATPSDAVHFAFLTRAKLRSIGPGSAARLLDRIGIHLGEVMVGEDKGKPKNLFGIQIDTCARVMSLAKAGQVLMTRAVFDSARQVLKGEDIEGVGQLAWLNHGAYLLKGLNEPVEICEVHEAGDGSGGPPTGSEKAQRQVRADEEPVLGWRPAVGQVIPNTRWFLERKLGEGGFGEVWLGRNTTTKQTRVFKFCFRAEGVRFLKRELTLFRLLKERVGEHPNIVAIHDLYLEKPPFYVEMDHVEGADLRHWCEQHAGVAAIPVETRLEIVAQAADGLQAAHEAGIIHRDIKPANILIGGKGTGPTEIRVKLTDFGIGQVVSEEYLKGITRAGFTQTLAGDSSSGTGTQLYMAPELLAGKPASIRSDIYSLGVVLYQLLAGSLTEPVTTDWAESVSHPLLREDLKHCFAGDPQQRFAGAGELAKRLRSLPEREKILAQQQMEQAARERAAYRRGIIRTATLGSAVAALLLILALVAWNQSRVARSEAKRAEQQRRRAERIAEDLRANVYAADMKAAQVALAQNNRGQAVELLDRYRPKPGETDLRGLEWRYLWQQARGDESYTWTHPGLVMSARFSPDGQQIVSDCFDGVLRVSDVRSKAQVATIPRGPHDNFHDESFCFSPDGKRLAATHPNGVVIIATSDWKTVRTLTAPPQVAGQNESYRSLAWSTDGMCLAAALSQGGVRVWRTPTWESSLLKVNVDGRMAFVPQRSDLAVQASHRIEIWDVISKARVREFTELAEPYSLAFSPGGEWLGAANNRGELRFWELRTGRNVWTTNAHESTVLGLCFSRDGKRLATGAWDQVIHVWDVATRTRVETFRGHLNEVWSLDFSPDDRLLLSASKDRTVKLWDLQAPRPLTQWWLETGDYPLGYSGDGRRIITAGQTNLQQWQDGKVVKTVDLDDVRLQNSAATVLLPGGQLVLIETNGFVHSHDLETGRAVRPPVRLTEDLPYVSAVSTGLEVLGYERRKQDEGGLCLWNGTTGALIAPLHDIPARAVFSTDGRLLAIMTTGKIRVLELPKLEIRCTLSDFEWSIFDLQFSNDGKFLAGSGGAGEASVWEIASGRRVVGPLRGHGSGVSNVQFSLDGRTLITGGYDHTVRFWNLATGREMLLFDKAQGPSFDKAFGTRLLSPGAELLVMWDYTREALRVQSIPSLDEIDLISLRHH